MAKINSNRKGKEAETEFVNLCKKYGFDKVRRSQQYSGMNEDADADVVGLPDLYVEVKRVESLNIGKAIEQCLRDKKEEDFAIVAHRKNNKPWLITMTFDDWMEIYKRYLIAK